MDERGGAGCVVVSWFQRRLTSTRRLVRCRELLWSSPHGVMVPEIERNNDIADPSHRPH